MDDDFDFQYSTIAEVKAEMSTKPQQSQDHTKTADSSDQSAKDSNKVSPPHSPLELNSQNPVTSSLLMNGHKTASEENVKSDDSSDAVREPIHTSSSSPTLASLSKEDLSQAAEQVDGKKQIHIYATVNKQKKSDSTDHPPPLPPPLAPNAEVNERAPPSLPTQTSDGEGEFEGLVFAPSSSENGNETKPRRPVPTPRAHVYEEIPNNIKKNLQHTASSPPTGFSSPPSSSFISSSSSSSSSCSSSSRRSTKRKKNSKDKEKSKMEEKPLPPLLTLSELEPLPSNGQSMRLYEFVHRFSHYLPLCVKVEEGYCGTEERFVISSGDIYNFHFVKNEKVVSIRDCGGAYFSIPFNSAIEFGIVYNPRNDFKAALAGYTFKAVLDLAAAKNLPRIICATKTHITADQKSSVQSDELLIIRKISRTTVMRKPVLKAFSLKTNEDKILQEDCEGHFTTNPERVKLYLPEILEHFGSLLPLEAMMYIRSEMPEDLPLHLTTDMVTLTHTTVESSIIASTCWEYEKREELSEEDQALVAIPINLDIEIIFLGRESEDKQLCESTKNFFEKFSSLKITDMKNSGGIQRGAGLTLAQRKLYRVVREGYQSKGTEIKMPFRLSGIFDGEMSPLSKMADEKHVYQSLDLPSEGGGAKTLLSPSHFKNKNHTTTSSNHTPSFPPHTQPLPPPPSSTAPPPPSSAAPPPPVTTPPKSDDKNHDELAISAVYSAIDDIFDSILDKDTSSAGYYYITDSASRRHTTSACKENPASNGGSNINSSTSQQPVPQPRVRSQTELVSSSAVSKGLTDIKNQMIGGRVGGSESKKEAVNGVGGGVGGSEEEEDEEGRERVRSKSFDELSRNYTELQREVQELRKELHYSRNVEAGYDMVSEYHHGRSFSLQQRPKSVIKANSMKDQEKNVEDLRSLDHVDIISLLEAMNLSQYKEQFMKEQVDGEILSECNEAILEKELRVTSAIHRTRLMKVITGRHAASSFINGSDLYSSLDHRT